MLGQIYGIPHKMNAQVWDLGLELGNGFETHIYQVLSSMLSAYFKYGVTIRHTSASRDDGNRESNRFRLSGSSLFIKRKRPGKNILGMQKFKSGLYPIQSVCREFVPHQG